jgi:putative ABC transport system permease protein
MKHNLIQTILKSLIYHRRDSVFQIIIVALLAAVITGSLFTGHSVRVSLRKAVSERLGNTDILITSGLRFFDPSLAARITASTGLRSVSILETEGFCQNFETGATALKTKILGITDDFFPFYGTEKTNIERGTAAINTKLAERLGIKTGDEIIIHFRETDPIPENAPFATSKGNSNSMVLKVSQIITAESGGNFSLGTSQVIPMNIFLNPLDAGEKNSKKIRVNRLLIRNNGEFIYSEFSKILEREMEPGDLGLTVRRSIKTGEAEIISDRIFIDSATVNEIEHLLPEGSPVLTYLANSISYAGRSTPYSFITTIPVLPSEKLDEDGIAINKWLSDDLGATVNDTVELKWFSPETSKRLAEFSRKFIIKAIIDNDSKYSDPTLMPDFPGISGSATCAGWDAGVPVLLDRIREKDEEYWNRFRGTPKAFISYETGKSLWGNNFGPATAVRFPASVDTSFIKMKLSGRMDPEKTGFMITDLRETNINAANEGVDFSMLFLCLSLFIIVSCLVLLSMVLTLYFNSRKKQIDTLFAIGFRNSHIKKLLFAETAIISVAGAFVGIFLGYLINLLIIRGLNSVWYGAVQMNTIIASFDFIPLVSGFLITLLAAFIMLFFKLRSYLRLSGGSRSDAFKLPRQKKNFLIMTASFIFAITLFILSLLAGMPYMTLSFAAGTLIFISMITALRYYYIKRRGLSRERGAKYFQLFYLFNPSQATAPAMFIAAGIFAIIITGTNRQTLSDKMLLPSGGTGGFLLWAESALPIKFDLNSPQGRKEFGFDEAGLRDIKFIQGLRVSGDDASCLNINHVSAPTLLGIDPVELISRGSFSFASRLDKKSHSNPWILLNENPGFNTIYGIADQTVLEWSLKLRTGDTIKYRAENGQALNIVICAGLKSSVFQGYLIIGEANLRRFFPSVPGGSVFLIEGTPDLGDIYKDAINERLTGFGVSVESAGDKLSSFFTVTNTYIEVFMVLGILGLILGSAGFGLVLIRNLNERKREFAVEAAMGYPVRIIRKYLLKDHFIILVWGVITGTLSALTATGASIRSGSEMPVIQLLVMLLLIMAAGITALLITVKQVRQQILITQLRRE